MDANALADLLRSDTLALAVALACFGAGAWLGGWFPDIDLKIRYIRHRSILTHGFIMPALMLLVVGAARNERVDWFIAGFATGVAAHLAFDLFPESWRGYAMISAPIYGSLSRRASKAWIALSAFACLSASLLLAPGTAGAVACAVALAALYIHGVTAQKESAVGPFIILVILGSGAWALASNADYLRELLGI